MPYMPILDEGKQSRNVTDIFRGYAHKLKIRDGQFYDTKNLTNDYYPVLASREGRKLCRSFTDFQGMCSVNDKLAWVEGGTLYYDGEATGISGLGEGKKQLVTTGAYICIFPDGMYYNTVNAQDSGSMNARLKIYNAELEVRMCNIDGVEYGEAEESDSAPETVTEGALWLDTKYKKLKQYSGSTAAWVEIPQVYTKIIFPTLPEGSRPSDRFEKNDGVSMSGFADAELNGSKILYCVGESYIVVAGIVGNGSVEVIGEDTQPETPDRVGVIDVGEEVIPNEEETIPNEDEELVIDEDLPLDGGYVQSGANIEIRREIPQMDFVIECQNRLWGCYYGERNGTILNEIYACVLGDFKNWERVLGIATDSYTASVGTVGAWTGAVNYLGYPTFFKERHIHRVVISQIGAHQIIETPARGVQEGSEASLSLVNETLYYHSSDGVCVYGGGFPSDISEALGEVKYHSAAGGAINGKYYISMLDHENTPQLFVYNIERRLWMREDNTEVKVFACAGNELYAATADGGLYAMTNFDGTAAEKIDWYAESGMLYYEYPNKKYISRFNLRLKTEKSSRLRIFIEYDSDGIWTPSGEVFYTGTGTITVPVKPRRCDHLRIRLEGSGFFRLFSIAKIFEEGSDY